MDLQIDRMALNNNLERVSEKLWLDGYFSVREEGKEILIRIAVEVKFVFILLQQVSTKCKDQDHTEYDLKNHSYKKTIRKMVA